MRKIIYFFYSMKRFALFSCSLFLCLLVSKANPISRSQALSQAKEFLSSKGISLKTNDAAYRAPRKANAQSDETSAYYYVFNAGNDQGFVIVSGDDRTEQILGYSDTGSFDEDDMPEPLQDLLKGYEREIEALGDLDVSVLKASPKKVIEKTKKAIAPMTTSQWGHGYPYSEKTPTYVTSSGVTKHMPAGCTPVMGAQLLYYYKDIVKTVVKTINSTYTAGTKLDWSNMIDKYSFNIGYTTTQINAVANLMLCTGNAMKATYTNNATSVTRTNAKTALIDYFGFNPEIAFASRDYYSLEDWENTIYNELADGRIVPYFGEGTAGHAFLIDGYDANGLFHVNWGWKGADNGYFRLSSLNRYQPDLDTYADKASYIQNQQIFLYANPASLGSANPKDYKLSAKISSVSGTSITCVFANQSGFNGSYYFALGYLENGNIKLIKQASTSASSITNGNILTKAFTLSKSDFESQNLPIGKTYNLIPLYKLSGENEWKICQYNPSNYAIVNYATSGLSASLHSTASNLSVSKFEFDGNGLKGSEQTVFATIKNNNTDYGFNNYVYLFASTSTTKGSSLGSVFVNLGKQDELQVCFPFTPSSAGTYNIWISTDASCSHVIGQTTLKISSATTPTVDLTKAGYSINPDFSPNYAGKVNDRVSIWGTTFGAEFTNITNSSSYPVTKKLNVWLREYDNLSATAFNSDRWGKYADNAIYYIVYITIPAKSSYTLPVIFKNLKLNTKYDIRVEESGNGNNYRKTQPVVMLPAITTYVADGKNYSFAPTSSFAIGDTIVAVDITLATAVKTIKPNSNPNVLYYMDASQTVPSGLTGKNVVKGATASNITLKDGYDFVVPKTFTAQSIQFSTIPTKGAKKGTSLGWNTISLPFDVTKVMNTTDKVEIDWFHSNDDSGKNFWVRGFEYLDTEGDNIYFDNVPEMIAYEPYIFNVPGEFYGNKWNLTNKEITFYGENAEIQAGVNHGVSSSVCNFYGTTTKVSVKDSYVLNEGGDYFTHKEDAQTVPAFQGYFYFKDKEYLASSKNKTGLRIKFVGDEEDNTTDGIMIPFAENEQVDVYNLNGVKVATKNVINGSFNIDDLPKGVYIINGHKFIH